MSVMESQDIERQVIEAIVAKLSSCKKNEREAAEAAIRRLGPTAMPDLLAILIRERDSRKKKQKIMGASFTGAFVLMVTISAMGHVNVFGSLGGLIGPIAGGLFMATQTQRSVVQVLAQLEDLRTVGVLAEALEYQDQKIGKLAENALITLLPRLKASDAHLLDTHQRACLYRALNRKNTELVLAILKALEQVGDGDAAPYVQKLADGHGAAARNFGVRMAAQQCLPYLQQLAAEQRARQTLLRASSAADALTTAPDTLLRPASGVTIVDPQELLRATAPTETPRAETSQHTPSLTRSTTIAPQPEETAVTMQPVGRG